MLEYVIRLPLLADYMTETDGGYLTSYGHAFCDTALRPRGDQMDPHVMMMQIYMMAAEALVDELQQPADRGLIEVVDRNILCARLQVRNGADAAVEARLPLCRCYLAVGSGTKRLVLARRHPIERSFDAKGERLAARMVEKLTAAVRRYERSEELDETESLTFGGEFAGPIKSEADRLDLPAPDWLRSRVFLPAAGNPPC